MKKITIFLCFALLIGGGCFLLFSFTSLVDNPLSDNEQKAKELLKKLTLEDKVGEMTQLSIDVLMQGQPYNLTEPNAFDEAKLKKVLVDLRVGSILNVGGHAYTRTQWEKFITRIQNVATKEKASGIPVLYGIDAIHGTNYTQEGTLFPQQLGLAATWNPAHAYSTGKITAYETRASGIPWSFAPVLDIGRDPRWPRLWETFGEDVLLASTMGAEMVKGFQENPGNNQRRVAATMKHFLGYSMPWTGRDRTQAWIPERQLREYFVPTFKAAIDAGALTVMINSGEMNGIPVHANPKILKDLLRTELGFKGIALTDWEDISYLVTRHRIAKDFKEAIKIAINAGIDMAMVPMDTQFPILLKELVDEGHVSMERIDEAVTRILALKYELGLFEQPYFSFASYNEFSGAKHQAAAKKAAEESIVLLKNENKLLPLDTGAKILVTGPTANNMRSLNGGWTGSWQGDKPGYSTKNAITILKGMEAAFGKANVTYVPGTEYSKAIDIDAAVAAAKGKDAVVLCLGELSYTEIPGNVDDLNLPDEQIALAEAIAKTGTPVILILAEGRPRIARKVEPLVASILAAFYPGDHGGVALAEVISGKVNPSGKLPITYPKFSNALLNYDHKGTDLMDRHFGTNGFDPQWEFGTGMSYTSFGYSDLVISSPTLPKSGDLTISATVTNTGTRAGMETVQLYITDEVASITPSVKRLRGFKKINLAAGATEKVSFKITAKDLAFVGIDHKWVTEKGGFKVMIGELKGSFDY